MVVAAVRRPAVRHRRGQRHRRTAADGPPDGAALPELRRPLRAAGRGPERRPTRRSTPTSSSRRPTSAPTLPPACGSPCRPTTGSRCASRSPPRRSGAARSGSAAVSGERADSATVSLPVYTPSTSETFATYGVLDERRDRPAGARPDRRHPAVRRARGVDVVDRAAGAHRRRALPHRLPLRDRPTGWPRGCWPISSLRDVLDAFDAPELPSAGEIDAADGRRTSTELDGAAERRRRLPVLAARPAEPSRTTRSRPRTRCSSPRRRATPCPADAIARGLDALGDDRAVLPAGARRADARGRCSAYALHVRTLAGQRDPAAAAGAVRRGAATSCRSTPSPGCGRSSTTPPPTRRSSAALANVAVDTAGAVTFTTGITDDGAAVTLASDRRTDGLVLDALLAERPDSDLIPKVVRGLLGGQGADGRWDNVQENAFILLALRHYFDAFEATDPRLRGPGLARRPLRRRAGVRRPHRRPTNVIAIPTAELIAVGDADRHVGQGGRRPPLLPPRAAHRAGDLDLAAARPRLRRRPHVRGGRRPGRRHPRRRRHVAHPGRRPGAGAPDDGGREPAHPRGAGRPAAGRARDPQPGAGDVAGARRPPTDDDAGRRARSWWWGDVVRPPEPARRPRRGVRRATCGAGIYDYTYVAQATTPGKFVVPPTRAEEIYAPETFGRAATDRVVVG